MAVITFIYNTPQKSIGGFVIDAFLKESYSFKNQVTDVPIEEGSTISDHVIPEQDKISIEGFIGRTEFVVMNMNGMDENPELEPSNENRIKQNYRELKRLKESRQPLTLSLGLDVYKNMIITDFDIDRDVESGRDLPFTMSFTQVKIVKSETTAINVETVSPKNSQQTNDQITEQVNQGVNAPEKPKDSIAKQEWKRRVEMEGNSPEILKAYEKKWGTAYPQ